VKFLLDLLPVLAFFGAYRVARALPVLVGAWLVPVTGPVDLSLPENVEMGAVLFATICAMLVSLVQIGTLLLRRRAISPTVWVGAVLIVVFGGLTIWLRNPVFIKWKPSLLSWIFAIGLGGVRLVTGRNALASLMGSELELPARVWDRLLVAWVIFFCCLGAANLAAAYAWSTDDWVNFKTFGLQGLTLLFSLGTGVYAVRHLPPEKT
jgi:intracellular septation protein